MTPEQLALVVERTGHERYRWLTSDDNPDVAQRDAYRATVVRLAGGPRPPTPTVAVVESAPLPTLGDQLVGLARSLRDWARSGFALASSAERRRRRSICTAPCPSYDPARRRCTACGCMTALKPWLASATCPRGEWALPERPA